MTPLDEENDLLNDQIVNVLFSALDVSEFNRVKGLKDANEIWNSTGTGSQGRRRGWQRGGEARPAAWAEAWRAGEAGGVRVCVMCVCVREEAGNG